MGAHFKALPFFNLFTWFYKTDFDENNIKRKIKDCHTRFWIYFVKKILKLVSFYKNKYTDMDEQKYQQMWVYKRIKY